LKCEYGVKIPFKTHTSPSPLGGDTKRGVRGAKPLLHNPVPLSFGGEILKGELEGRSPSYITQSPSPLKERGTKGVR